MLEKINIHEEFDNYFVIVDFTEKKCALAAFCGRCCLKIVQWAQ
jgi:hypothetical protein